MSTTSGKFYTIIDMGKYKQNTLAYSKAINNNTMVDLASVYEGTVNDNMDVVTDTEDPSGYRGFYIKHSTTGVLTSLGLRGQEPGSVIDDAGVDKEKFNVNELNEMKSGISLNNETGFKVNRGQGADDVEDFGKDCIMNISKQGKVTFQHQKQLYYQTGSMVVNVQTPTGGGGGAGGGSEQSNYLLEGRKNGGSGGNAGKTYDKIILYPQHAIEIEINSVPSMTGGGVGGAGGAGGNAGGYAGQNGQNGQDSTTNSKIFGTDESTTLFVLETAVFGGKGGNRGRTGNNSNGSSGAEGDDVQLTVITPGLQYFDYKTSPLKSMGGYGGPSGGKENGHSGQNGRNGSADILIHLLGSSGLHRNIPT